LAEERANFQRANTARLEAERRCHAAEKERDVYRILARRWKTRVHASAVATEDTESIEEAAAAMLLGSRDSMSVLGLGNMFRRFRARTSAAAAREEADEDEEEDELGDDALDPTDRMEEDNDDEMSEGTSTGDEEDESDEDVDSFSFSSHQGSQVGVPGSGDHPLRPQPRTVSLSEEDF
jgi:hypothetical protein